MDTIRENKITITMLTRIHLSEVQKQRIRTKQVANKKPALFSDAHYVKPTKKKPRKTLSWYAYGRAAYQGGENTFNSEYDCRAEAKGFVDTNIGKWKGNVWKSAHMRVVIYPQPVGVDVHINDCNSHGDISTTNPTTGQTSTSRAEIPFTSQ